MTKKLKISIGPHRHQLKVAYVNDSARPTIIDSELFVGRVLVKIRDFDGITPDGSPPIRDHVYFDGRSRRFDIQIEGRFKRRPGVPLYTGEEIHFGSDFDHLVEFPKSAFNAGMRVARWIDPNTFYDLSPISGRPFIMSPYLACMNTLCAWPSPSRMSDALVCLHQTTREEDYPSDEGEDMVPMEQVDQADVGRAAGNKKIGRHPKRYWRFIGLKGDGGRIDAFLEKNKALLAERPLVDVSQMAHSRTASHDTATHDDAEDDDDDALSCRAPSSHATYSTAIEGRPPMSSASSYRFSQRIFPRHQISFGAGMRDLYQDAETEAQEREGEARAQEVMDTVGEDDLVMCPPMPPMPPQPTSLERNQSADSSEESKKHGVKHRLRKLKTALQKLAPTGLSSSTSSSSLGAATINGSPPTHNKFTTALHHYKQPKNASPANNAKATVTRAASRTLPFTRRSRTNLPPQAESSTSTSTSTSTSPSPAKPVGRSNTLASRPVSQPPVSSNGEITSKLRSTSFDHNNKRLALGSSPVEEAQANAAEPGPSPAPPQTLSVRTFSTLSKPDSVRVSSPSTYHNSDEASSRSTTSAGPQPVSISQASSSTMRALVADDKLAVPNPAELTPSNISDTDVSSAASARTSTLLTHSPPTGGLTLSSTSSSGATSTSSLLAPATVAPNQPTKHEIERAPVLEDVEKGDLMFADMLNVPEDAFADEVGGELGPWRFRNPTTDILEDNTFVFLNKSVDVQKRRKYFSEAYGKHRKAFTYDPDVVYATSFFSPFMNFNTFDLAIGPVKMNVAKVFGDMPIRYTLRSTRVPEGSPNSEEEVFVTIAFELVDE
ncbi:hypothetical protein CROQUDRAFT_632458 [Cronartium quercuum f. sp. fusiforme G11]|uniref:Domain of unknown function at the cortex 1 domain-containing protein n=1 Tax=Cronartium quercuum f. sp. fusiforme G11 TaxID=708437 RepID=A0A9P6NS39_9BASI|nr:hypothetical protein CROQUDRAFT_632458 [Cronartium quercuum f. sp. fusiforme G11]